MQPSGRLIRHFVEAGFVHGKEQSGVLDLASRCKPPDRIAHGLNDSAQPWLRPRWTAADHSDGTKPGFLLGASAASHQCPPGDLCLSNGIAVLGVVAVGLMARGAA